MMNKQHLPSREDGRLDAVLAALREAEPVDGLEQRVLRRLAAEPAHLPRVRFAAGLLPYRWVLAAALTVCVLCVWAWTGLHSRREQGLQSMSTPAKPDARTVPQYEASVQPRSKPEASDLRDTSAEWNRSGTASARARQNARLPDHVIASITVAQREPSYPAPVMPLTEQERLLLRVAHGADPVQLAMLDPVERDLQHRRERAETTRFFTPQPLPPEMHQEMIAALRSQYVNTPPPDDQILESMTRRNDP